MTKPLTNEDAVRRECLNHTLTVTPYVDPRGLACDEPVKFQVDCSCGGLHMEDPINEVMLLIQSHMRGHGVPVSPWWYRTHPDHPRMARHD